MRRFLLAAAAACLIPCSALAKGDKVALTFDDAPGLSIFHSQPYTDYFNFMLLRGLRQCRLSPSSTR